MKCSFYFGSHHCFLRAFAADTTKKCEGPFAQKEIRAAKLAHVGPTLALVPGPRYCAITKEIPQYYGTPQELEEGIPLKQQTGRAAECHRTVSGSVNSLHREYERPCSVAQVRSHLDQDLSVFAIGDSRDVVSLELHDCPRALWLRGPDCRVSDCISGARSPRGFRSAV